MSSLLDRFTFASERESLDFLAINVPQEKLIETMEALRTEFNFNLLTDVTAIDWGQEVSPRFTGVYHLHSHKTHEFIRIAANCEDDENPTLPSLTSVWPAANWHERETYDMFGIRYEGHPDLRRILMWDEYPYYPLRKEFPLAGWETELPGEDVAEVTEEKVIPAPMMGGPFHAPQEGAMSKREPRADDESWTENAPKPS